MPSPQKDAMISDEQRGESVPLRKLTIFSKANLLLLHVFFSAIQLVLQPFGLAVPVGTAFLASMFGFMIFVPPLVCWMALCVTDVFLPGTYQTVMDVKAYWISTILIWYLFTLATDKAPRTPVGANHRRPTNLMNSAAHNFYFWNVIDYFPIECVPWADDATLPPDRQYIVAIHPHGIFCWGLFMFAAAGTPFDKRFPGLAGKKLVGLIATVLFIVPVIRDFFLEWPYIDASRAVASKALSSGLSLYLIPGGEEEVVVLTQGEDATVIMKRKGFIRLALSYGADLVPVWGEGTTDSFCVHPSLFGFRKFVQKRFGVAIANYHGRWFTPLPYKDKPVRILIGKPIQTPQPKLKGEKPDPKLVDEYHAKYVAALKELHDAHVKDRPLKIL
mmetsp:Transcript_9234/g.21745  ORF Transcript_9234/g.21745 Transcript_9234/m.21745 type:complete len:388 (-) Transcript_9234:70-1233(-)